eukprot:TRINITY_DN12071_c0_g1_i1.p1 TRINITY_DN12071_c0_g1~~TRINITY_DN12071_c0_g1_i1.p1  ORF type:complete len:538 (-),score=138.47 TRINITY_DN12071_c0_g1_i1:56-1489(-)
MYNFPDDGYDYSHHLKTIGDGSFFLQKADESHLNRKKQTISSRAPDPLLADPEESIVSTYFFDDPTITGKEMDPDILKALENEDTDDGELPDDFVRLANRKTGEHEISNFDKAIEDEKVSGKSRTTTELLNFRKDQKDNHLSSQLQQEEEDEFEEFLRQHDEKQNKAGKSVSFDNDVDDRNEPYMEEWNDHGTGKDYSRAKPDREPTLLEQKFQFELKRYEDTMDNDDLEEATTNPRGLDILKLEDLLDDFIEKKKPVPLPENIYYEEKKAKLLANVIATNRGEQTTTVSNVSNDTASKIEESQPTSQSPMSDAKNSEDNTIPQAVEINPEIEDYEEETDSDSEYDYLYMDKKEEQWDCESIISTYSNTENHPTLIEEEVVHKIKMNKKGIPIEVLKALRKKKAEETIIARQNQNCGEARPKNESREDKKARKKALKSDRKQKRQQKKNLKEEYKRERLRYKQAKNATGVAPALVHY